MQKQSSKEARRIRDSGIRRHHQGRRAIGDEALGPCHSVVRVEMVPITKLVRGAVVRARVPYAEDPTVYKVRPVVVVAVRGRVITARMCTSAASRHRYATTVEITGLACAGLDKATGVRDRLVDIDLVDVIDPLGRLSAFDSLRVFGSDEEYMAVAA